MDWDGHADAPDDTEGVPALVQSTPAQNLGTILVDNHLSLSDINIDSLYDDEQGFTTGPELYRLTGVEITVSGVDTGESFALAIIEGTSPVPLQSPLYELVAPADKGGKVFFAAPENAYLEPNSHYFVRFTMTAGDARIGRAHTTDESDSGLSGWSVADNYWTSNGASKGLSWTSEDNFVFAITVRGEVIPDKFGKNTYKAGYLAFSRYTGESPTVNGFINGATDTDWFDTSLSYDYGGRYRIDVKPIALTNNDDIGVRSFYVDYRNDHSRDPAVELTSLDDSPEGYVSWHFIAGRNYGPHFEVYADNGTTGAYAIRVVYDPDRVWTGTEVVRGDLPHDDTTWATIEVDADVPDEGIYHDYDDHDWFAIVLESETSYLFLAIAAGSYSSYIDPAIRLYDDGGNELAVDYVSGDETSSSITHPVGTGEGGIYYIDVTNSVLMDDAASLVALGLADPFEILSPFLGTKYYVIASEIGGGRSGRSARSSVPTNTAPRIYNRTGLALLENSILREYITADDQDAEDSITGYEISSGDDQDLFSVSTKGALSMTITPDFEVPADADMDNDYEVQVTATSGAGTRERSATADITVSVTDDDTEAERVLVSNTGQAVKGNATVNSSDSALRFDTGPSKNGYALHSVALSFAEPLVDPASARVSLRSMRTVGSRLERPNVELFAFTNPSRIDARLTEFTAPQDTVLEADTTYYVHIERVGDVPLKFKETGSDSKDEFSAAGWRMGTIRLHRPRHLNGPWGRSADFDRDQVLFRVIGSGRSSE